jgi:hypothetical protein
MIFSMNTVWTRDQPRRLDIYYSSLILPEPPLTQISNVFWLLNRNILLVFIFLHFLCIR